MQVCIFLSLNDPENGQSLKRKKNKNTMRRFGNISVGYEGQPGSKREREREIKEEVRV